VVGYRLFGTTYRSYFQGSSSLRRRQGTGYALLRRRWDHFLRNNAPIHFAHSSSSFNEVVTRILRERQGIIDYYVRPIDG